MAQIAAVDSTYYLTSQERLNSYIFRTYTDPTRLAWMLIDAATDHWSQAPRQWDRSAQSYSFRVASGWGRRIVTNTALLGFEAALHEDSRYRRSGEKRLKPRIWFALTHSVLAYKSDGSVEPMYGRMAAGVVSAATSSRWHPQAINVTSLSLGVGQGILDRTGGNLLTEFEPDLRKFGQKARNALHRK